MNATDTHCAIRRAKLLQAIKHWDRTSAQRSHWFDYPELSFYVRKSHRKFGSDTEIQGTIDIANISVADGYQHQGWFTDVRVACETFAYANHYKYVYIENVLNDGLAAHLRKQAGYHELDVGGLKSFWKVVTP